MGLPSLANRVKVCVHCLVTAGRTVSLPPEPWDCGRGTVALTANPAGVRGPRGRGGAALLRAGTCSLSWLSQVLSAWSLSLLPWPPSTEDPGERTCLALMVHLPVEVHGVYCPCVCLSWGAQGRGDWSMVTPPIPGSCIAMAPELGDWVFFRPYLLSWRRSVDLFCVPLDLQSRECTLSMTGGSGAHTGSWLTGSDLLKPCLESWSVGQIKVPLCLPCFSELSLPLSLLIQIHFGQLANLY